jgi:aspartate aminotransferase-like enzyme
LTSRSTAAPNFGREFFNARSTRLGVGPDAAHADAGIIDDRFDRAKARASGGDGALAAFRIGKIGENRMKAILGARMPGAEPLKRLDIAIDRGDAMARRQQRIRHRNTDAARCSGEKNDAAARQCHDLSPP